MNFSPLEIHFLERRTVSVHFWDFEKHSKKLFWTFFLLFFEKSSGDGFGAQFEKSSFSSKYDTIQASENSSKIRDFEPIGNPLSRVLPDGFCEYLGQPEAF